MTARAASRALLLATALVLGGGCGSPAPIPEERDSLLGGHLSLGPDSETFLPCGAHEPLQLHAPAAMAERLRAQYLTLVGEPYEEAFLRLRGRTAPGDEQRLQVAQILDFRVASPDDCR
jgi:hypothetical protein